MPWTEQGSLLGPAPPLGQAVAAQSMPFVGPSDIDVQTNDGDTQNLLAIIASALQAIASTRGVLADLRVTPTGTVTTSGSTSISSGTVTSLSQIGAVPANSVVQDWENQTYTSSFSANVTRP